MKRQRSVKREIFAIIISIIIVIIPAVEMIGRPVKWVFVLTIVAGSLVTGVSLGRLAERIRRDKEAKAAAYVDEGDSA